MGKKTGSVTTYGELATLAASCGLVDQSEQGRKAFVAWLSNDPAAAKKALFGRVAARQVAASAPKAATAPQNYPVGWLRAAGVGRSRVASRTPDTAQAAAPAVPPSGAAYPGGWLAAAGIGGRRATGPRVTEGRD